MQKEKLIFKNSKGQKLVGILHKPENKKEFPVAIFCHGFRSDKNNSKTVPIGKKLTGAGIGFFAFDFSGRGESAGRFEDTTITQYIDDLTSCLGFISGYTENIAVIGSSLGGLVTLHAAARYKRIKTITLLSPVSAFPWKKTHEFSYENVRKWKKDGYIFTHSHRFGDMKLNYSFYKDLQNYRRYDRYKKIGIPVLIIHGDKDESVNFEDSVKLKTYIKKSKLIILKNVGHEYSKKKDFERMVKETAGFIARNMK